MTTSATEPIETLEIEQPDEPQPADAEPVIHLARCAECGGTVRYQLTASGHGLMVVDRTGFAAEQSFGLSDDGLPMCPEGHGIMPLADEQLPVAEAFELAQEQLQKPPRLPFPSPPFNYEAALHEIFEKRAEIERLEIRFNDADDRRKKAKAALDEGNEELGKMIDILKEREEERLQEIARKEADAAAGHPEGTNLVRCKWEEQHPGEVCPICSDEALKAQKVEDSEAHVEEADALLDLRSATEVSDALEMFGIMIPVLTIQKWTADERAAVKAYAESAGTDPRPSVLGTCHVAGEVKADGDPQCCTQCDQILIAAGDDANFYAEGILVGTDCRGAVGKAAEEGQHYPQRGKRKRSKASE